MAGVFHKHSIFPERLDFPWDSLSREPPPFQRGTIATKRKRQASLRAVSAACRPEEAV